MGEKEDYKQLLDIDADTELETGQGNDDSESVKLRNEIQNLLQSGGFSGLKEGFWSDDDHGDALDAKKAEKVKKKEKLKKEKVVDKTKKQEKVKNEGKVKKEEKPKEKGQKEK